MDFKIFIDALSEVEMNALSRAIHERRESIANEYPVPLSSLEKDQVLNGSWIEAIKMYRNRNSCDLMTAKVKVDNYRDQLQRRYSQHPKGNTDTNE